MAANDPTYQPGDTVMVYASGALASVALGQAPGYGHPREATIVRQHPLEPGLLEIAYQDGQQPTSEYVDDHLRFRRHAVLLAHHHARADEIAALAAEHMRHADALNADAKRMRDAAQALHGGRP
jgi:hypothetical protein